MTTYGYPDTCYTTHQKPHLLAVLSEQVEQTWKAIDFVVEYCLNHNTPLPEELGEMHDKAHDLEHRKAQAYKAWCNGDDPELEELEF